MNSLYNRLCAKEHLRDAWKALNKSNRHSFGIDEVTLDQFRKNLDHELSLIHDQLRSRSYTFAKLRGVTIPKPGSNEPRPIQIPAIRDRVVMKALAILIEPKLSPFNLPCSFAYIKGKSIHGAIARMKELADEGNHWVVEADISNFFGNVDQELLLRRLHAVVGARSIFRCSIRPSKLRSAIGEISSHNSETCFRRQLQASRKVESFPQCLPISIWLNSIRRCCNGDSI